MGSDADTATLEHPGTRRAESTADQTASEMAATATGEDRDAGHGRRTGKLHRLYDHLRQPVVRTRLAVMGGLVAASGLVAAVNPASNAPYPPCPTRTFLGFDCPACGGLRGTHALINGNVADALDYNLLLPLLLVTLAVPVALWALPILGRATPRFTVPRWFVPALIAIFGLFSVLRNLPFEIFEPLAADLTR